MSGFIFIHGECISCKTFISFHPHKVPSLPVNGKREPLCIRCFHKWNEIHRPNDPVQLKEGAYEPGPESDLDDVPDPTVYHSQKEE
jgi:hypothetical protein